MIVYLFVLTLSYCCIYLHFTSGVTAVCTLDATLRSAGQFIAVYRMIEQHRNIHPWKQS